MTPSSWLASVHIAELRKLFREEVKPGRVLNAASVALIATKINSCFEIAREFEAEHFFEQAPRPVPAASANVIPLRRKPRFFIVYHGPSDGGDAA